MKIDKPRKEFMDQNFKERIIRDHENTDPENKRALLQVLKFEPEKFLRIISDNLPNWQHIHMMTATEPFFVNFVADPPELLKAFQEHFAKELEAIT